MKKRILSYSHAILALCLAAFFVYAGIKKFTPKNRPVTAKSLQEIGNAVSENKYESPITFKLTTKSMRESGFLKVVGVLQILAGLLIFLPKTRLIGLGILLPVTINIFLLHLLMDNRPDENFETGLFLAVNLLLICFYWKRLKLLIVPKA